MVVNIIIKMTVFYIYKDGYKNGYKDGCGKFVKFVFYSHICSCWQHKLTTQSIFEIM